MKKTVTPLMLAILISACASHQAIESPSSVANTPIQKSAPLESNSAEILNTHETKIVGNPLKDPNNILSKRSIYFDFDKYEIKSEYRALAEAHAQYLISNPTASIRIEGNADDRGSREYNLSLGQKRASAVKKALNLIGVQDKQIETVSYGEEKPKAIGEDETAHAMNRRADIVYSGE